MNEKCRRLMHLDAAGHWDFKGRVTCKRCGAEMDIQVLGGRVKSRHLHKVKKTK